MQIANFRQRLQENPRLATILHGGASGVLGKGLSLLISFLTLPLTIRYLGRVEYGIWVTVSTSVVMLGILDIGLSSTLINFMSKAHAENDPHLARGYVSTAFWISAGLASMMAVCFALAWHWITWANVFSLHDAALSKEAAHCLAISVAFFLLNLPLSLGSKILGGLQKTSTANYFSMVNSVLGLIAILIAVYAHLSIVGLTISYSCAMLTGTLALNVWLYFVSRPWMRPSLFAVRRNMAKDLFGQGSLFFVLQIAGLVVFNSDNVVIAHYCGAGEVTPYSVSWRLMGYASMFYTLLIPSLWPAFADAYHRKDLDWIRSTYKRIMRMSMLAASSIAVILAVFGQWLIRVWATQGAVPSKSLLWAMAVWAVVFAATTNQACLLAATQRIGIQAITSTMAAIVNLAASIYLVQRMGPIGVIIATLISYLIFIVAPQSWEVGNILRGRYLRVENAQ